MYVTGTQQHLPWAESCTPMFDSTNVGGAVACSEAAILPACPQRQSVCMWFSPLEIRNVSTLLFVRRAMGLTVSFASAMHGMLFGAPVRCAHSCLIEHRHLVSRARAACSSCANGKSCTLCNVCHKRGVVCTHMLPGARHLPACSPHNTNEITCQRACRLVCCRTHSTRVHPSCARARLSKNILVSMDCRNIKIESTLVLALLTGTVQPAGGSARQTGHVRASTFDVCGNRNEMWCWIISALYHTWAH